MKYNASKYEGHTPTEEWGNIVFAEDYRCIMLDDYVYANDIDAELMADAARLLEEVKRLREQGRKLERDLIGLCEDNYIMQDIIKDYFKEMIE